MHHDGVALSIGLVVLLFIVCLLLMKWNPFKFNKEGTSLAFYFIPISTVGIYLFSRDVIPTVVGTLLFTGLIFVAKLINKD